MASIIIIFTHIDIHVHTIYNLLSKFSIGVMYMCLKLTPENEKISLRDHTSRKKTFVSVAIVLVTCIKVWDLVRFPPYILGNHIF